MTTIAQLKKSYMCEYEKVKRNADRIYAKKIKLPYMSRAKLLVLIQKRIQKDKDIAYSDFWKVESINKRVYEDKIKALDNVDVGDKNG